MPPTLVHAALGALIAAALLGPAFSRRGGAVVVAAAAAPDADALLQVAVPAAHGAVLHTLLLPGAAALLLWVDERGGAGGARRFRARVGAAGVRVAWVALLAWALAGTGLDLLNVDAANPLWPLTDRFVAVVGLLEVTTGNGLVQTFLGGGGGPYTFPRGYCVPTALESTCDRPADGHGQLRLVESGWQLLLVCAGGLALAVADRRADDPAWRGADVAGSSTDDRSAEDATAGEPPTGEPSARGPAAEGTAGDGTAAGEPATETRARRDSTAEGGTD